MIEGDTAPINVVSWRRWIISILLFGIFALLSATAFASGSLSGTVVDAADGFTPVHPVYISLWDPVNNTSVQGLGLTNGIDGSFVIDNIPEGSYKISYNAFGYLLIFSSSHS